MADLNSLVIFAKVVEARSISEAARRLKMPLSTVSRRVADLENQLGVRLLARSTRNLRLTDIGAQVLEQAQRIAEVSQVVENMVSEQTSNVSGVLRLSAPPSISDSLVGPVVGAFQRDYPEVRVQVFITDRIVDQIGEGIDVAFKVGALKDSSLIVRNLITYRHQLVCSPAYLKRHPAPERPQDLLGHRLLAFSFWKPVNYWYFRHASGEEEKLAFFPYVSMNDYAGLVSQLLAGTGIGDLPPLVQPDLLRTGRLVEVMPQWPLQNFNLSIVHLGGRQISHAVRLFKELAIKLVPTLFPELPH